MKKRTKIRHDRLENCSGKILTVTDLKTVIAVCIISITIHVREIKQEKGIFSEKKLSNIDNFPLKLMDCFSILGVCPSCKNILTGRFEHKYQLLDEAMEYLLKNDCIQEDYVKIPTIDELIKSIDRMKIFLDFDVRCDECDFEDARQLYGSGLTNLKSPKLTT